MKTAGIVLAKTKGRDIWQITEALATRRIWSSRKRQSPLLQAVVRQHLDPISLCRSCPVPTKCRFIDGLWSPVQVCVGLIKNCLCASCLPSARFIIKSVVGWGGAEGSSRFTNLWGVNEEGHCCCSCQTLAFLFVKGALNTGLLPRVCTHPAHTYP